jgi:amino acid transporter
MAPQSAAGSARNGGFARTLTAPRITLLVVAAAAPLGAVLGNVPIGIIRGNGPGMPVAFLIAGVLVVCFAIGFIAMCRAVPDATGFSAIIGAGLGRRAGLGAAYATLLSYGAGTIAIMAAGGYFSSLILDGYGLVLPWWAWSGLLVAVVALLGRRAADLGVRMLTALIAVEFLSLLALSIAVLLRHGWSAFPVASFAPETVFSAGLGVAMMFALTSFIGTESSVLYSREAKDPARSIPRATYSAVALIALSYFLASWLIIGALGAETAVEAATELEGDTVFAIGAETGGTPLLVALQVFFCTSLLACLLALHNATVRYLQTLAERRALPRYLGRISARSRGPAAASDTFAVLTGLCILAFAVVGADPYLGLNANLIGLFTVGIVTMQALTAMTAVVYFRRRRDARLWRTLVAPLVAFIGLSCAIVLIVANYRLLTEQDSLLPNLVPVLIVVAFGLGFIVDGARGRRGSGPGAEDEGGGARVKAREDLRA